MHLRIYDPRILAIDLRHRRFGYSVFEGHRLLLDWGVRVYPAVGNTEAEMVTSRLAELIRLFAPSAIVAKKERFESAQTNPHMQVLVDAVVRKASAHAIPICLLEQSKVTETFRKLGCESKEEIAAALARIFPELVWDLPANRRRWQSEHPRMPIFDATALGLAYWQHEASEFPSQPERDLRRANQD
jgi:hypothetical protein